MKTSTLIVAFGVYLCCFVSISLGGKGKKGNNVFAAFVQSQIEGPGSTHYSTTDNSNGCDCAFTLQTSGTLKFVPQFHWYGKQLVRTGPFASNVNRGFPFSTQTVSGLKTHDPKQNTLNSIIPFTDSDNICSGTTWKYQGQQDKTTPTGVPQTQKQAEIDIANLPITSIKGCFNDKINSISYYQEINSHSTLAASCGSNTEGIGFNAYPIDQRTNGCKFAFISGESETTTDVYLTDVYFYWDCDLD